nr:hypothetical protein [Tanacetum cinerariifolium]
MCRAFPLPVIKFPLAEEVHTASEDSSHCQKKRDAIAIRIALLVIEFGDSYEVPASTASTTTTDTTSGETSKKSGRTVTLTVEDMQKRNNDVKARTTLLLSLPDENQLRFTKHSRGNEDVNTASVSTASTNVPTASANIPTASISQDTACAYIASQSSGSQIKFKDINQIDEDDMEEIDIKWNMALLSMRDDKWVTLQGSAGLPEAKTEEGKTTTDKDVYSKRRIIAVTELKIVEWHNYKHLDWISVRRDDDKIYKFKEGDLKRLRIQDIEDMLLLLVQGKLSNLTVEERFAFNVSLRMFTRSIVIQRRVEDL